MENLIDSIVDYFSNLTPRGYVKWGSALAVVVLVISVLVTYVKNRNEGIELELGMVKFWSQMTVRYDQGRSQIVDGLNIAGEKRDAINKLVKDAIASRRFVDPNDPTKIDRNAFISAVQEAYPDTSGTDIYNRLIDQVQALRKGFAHDQTHLADLVRSYDDWRKTGSMFHPQIVRWLGFPSDNLRIMVNGHEYKGQQALNKLSVVIMSSEGGEIFDSGQDRRLQ
jgi:hypothetical protein